MNTLKIKSLILLFVILSFLFTSCGNKEKAEAPEGHHDQENETIQFTEAQYKTAGIQFGKIEMRSLSGVIPCNGVLDAPPQNLVSVSIPVGGILKTTELLQGMRVKKGQVIAVFEHPDYIQMQQEYIQARAGLEFSEAEYKRQEELNKENVNSRKTVQKSKADYLTLKAQASGLQKKLELMGVPLSQLEKGNIINSITIKSPINGYVTKVNVNIGKFVNPNDIIFEIVDTEHLHAELIVYEKDITKIKAGQVIRFSLSNEKGNERTAKVHLVGREINADRSIRIHGHLDVEDPELLPGMYINGVIETGSNKTASLPEKAIVQNAGKNYIFTRAGKRNEYEFTPVEISTGISENGYTEVIVPKGFDTNAEIVTNGAYDLLSKKFNSEEEGHAH